MNINKNNYCNTGETPEHLASLVLLYVVRGVRAVNKDSNHF